MHELREFQSRVIIVKRELKELFYTSRDATLKADAKQLVRASIILQKTIDDLLALNQKRRIAQKVLEDRKATLSLRKWSNGLPKRVQDYKQKQKKLSSEHSHKFQEVLLDYLGSITQELNDWIIDIETLADLPRPPKD
jgi:hypothetical protein